MGLQDKYSEYENIGLVVCEEYKQGVDINLLLLSCRVLNRGIETSVLHWIYNRAKSNSKDIISGKIFESKRNEPVRDIFSRHGFEKNSSESWVFDCRNREIKLPHWINLIDRTA